MAIGLPFAVLRDDKEDDTRYEFFFIKTRKEREMFVQRILRQSRVLGKALQITTIFPSVNTPEQWSLFQSIGIVLVCLGILVPSPGYVQAGTREIVPADHPSIMLRPIPQPSQIQLEEYNTQRPKSIVALQPFRETKSMRITTQAGEQGVATLINLHPRMNTWFLLQLTWTHGREQTVYHLENPKPASQRIILDPHYAYGLVIVTANERYQCALWADPLPSTLEQARASLYTYAPLCNERLYLRNPTKGHRTLKEFVTEWLRDQVWQGEQIVSFVREHLYRDAFLETAQVSEDVPSDQVEKPFPGIPLQPLLNPRYEAHFLVPAHLGIPLDNENQKQVLVGQWYPAQGQAGVFVSALQPQMVAEEVIQQQRQYVNSLDQVESRALVYLVAFDLQQFDLGFAMGTEHPRVDWSPRVQSHVRERSLPGPDGIATVAPLVRTGMVSSTDAKRIIATFTGGFKRYHGAFRWGEFALQNHGSHYGFIEHGVIMSKLQPGLATAIVFDDGTVELKTWTEQDNADLNRIHHARQNGVPIIDYDEVTGTSKPGELVSQWGPGNWSGSADRKLRTLRAGLCLQESKDHRFLIYGYFSSATPSAMARVFQAYHCKYAMHLDMNALEHTYLALYQARDSQVIIHHLITGMSTLDQSQGEQVIPRFVGYADNRDFFYLLRKRMEAISGI